MLTLEDNNRTPNIYKSIKSITGVPIKHTPYDLINTNPTNTVENKEILSEFLIDYNVIENKQKRRAISTHINRIVSAKSQHKSHASKGISQNTTTGTFTCNKSKFEDNF